MRRRGEAMTLVGVFVMLVIAGAAIIMAILTVAAYTLKKYEEDNDARGL